MSSLADEETMAEREAMSTKEGGYDGARHEASEKMLVAA